MTTTEIFETLKEELEPEELLEYCRNQIAISSGRRKFFWQLALIQTELELEKKGNEK